VRLGQLLAAPGVTIINDGTDRLRVSGITAEQIGAADETIQPHGPSTGMAEPYPSPRHATWPARRGPG
jgi:hypothetical protein